jgi:hypothetical protein
MPVVAYESGVVPFERRIGARYPADDIEVSWLDQPGREPEAGGWPGRIQDVSVTGAAVTGPSDLPMDIGSKAVIRYRGRDTGVVICRSEPTERPDVCRYGIEFVVLHPTLADVVHQAMDRARPEIAGLAPAREASPRALR